MTNALWLLTNASDYSYYALHCSALIVTTSVVLIFVLC